WGQAWPRPLSQPKHTQAPALVDFDGRRSRPSIPPSGDIPRSGRYSLLHELAGQARGSREGDLMQPGGLVRLARLVDLGPAVGAQALLAGVRLERVPHARLVVERGDVVVCAPQP